MCNSVAAFGVEFFDAKFFNEFSHAGHRISRRNAWCWYRVIRNDGNFIRIKDAGGGLVAAGAGGAQGGGVSLRQTLRQLNFIQICVSK